MKNLIEAAKAVVKALDSYDSVWRLDAEASVLRAALAEAEREPAPALPEGTVAVPAEMLRELCSLSDSNGIADDLHKRALVAIHRTIKSLLQPAAPEPPKELVAEWERKATAFAERFTGHEPRVAGEISYVAALRAEWQKKGGA